MNIRGCKACIQRFRIMYIVGLRPTLVLYQSSYSSYNFNKPERPYMKLMITGSINSCRLERGLRGAVRYVP